MAANAGMSSILVCKCVQLCAVVLSWVRRDWQSPTLGLPPLRQHEDLADTNLATTRPTFRYCRKTRPE